MRRRWSSARERLGWRGRGHPLHSAGWQSPSFTHYDGRGDVTAKTDSGGAVTYQASYEAFGNADAGAGLHAGSAEGEYQGGGSEWVAL